MGFLVTLAEVLAAIGVVVAYILDFNRTCLTSSKNEVLVGGLDKLVTARDRRIPCWVVGGDAEGMPMVSYADLSGSSGGMPADGLVRFEGGFEGGLVLCHPSASEGTAHRLASVSDGDVLWVPKGWTITH